MERGVYRSAYANPSGGETLILVDSAGRCLARIHMTPPADRLDVLDLLRGLLDELDPPSAPELRLHRAQAEEASGA